MSLHSNQFFAAAPWKVFAGLVMLFLHFNLKYLVWIKIEQLFFQPKLLTSLSAQESHWWVCCFIAGHITFRMEKRHSKRLFYVLWCALRWLWQYLSFSLPTLSFVFQFPSFPALAMHPDVMDWMGSWNKVWILARPRQAGRQDSGQTAPLIYLVFLPATPPTVLVLGPLLGRARPVCCVVLLLPRGQMIIRDWLETLGYTGGQGWDLKVKALTARCRLLLSQPPARSGPGRQDATPGTDCCPLHFITHLPREGKQPKCGTSAVAAELSLGFNFSR